MEDAATANEAVTAAPAVDVGASNSDGEDS